MEFQPALSAYSTLAEASFIFELDNSNFITLNLIHKTAASNSGITNFVKMKPTTHKSYSVKEATIKLMQFCAYRDRSQKEVEEKLKEMRMIPAACEQIIIQLMQEDFLNEERFARSFVRGKFRMKKWGRNKIKQELKFREISAPLIKMAFSEIEEKDYLQTLEQLAEKKAVLIKEKDPFKKRKKLANYLIQKGYEPGLVFETCQNITP